MSAGAENLARVVIYDPVKQNLRVTRYGLYEAGFREIEGYSELSELKRRLEEGPLDLLVAETGDQTEIYDLVRNLRHGQLSDNPFTTVFLTSWRSDSDSVKDAMRCGADDVIIRPFSTNFIDTRIKTAVDHRKQFVVTSDYTGPDRRRDPERAADPNVRLFDAPNTLKTAVAGDQEALEAGAAEIENFKAMVRRERAVRLAVKIGVECQLAMVGERPASMIYSLARQLYVAVDQVDAEAARLAAAMVRKLSAAEDVQKTLKLTRELALGVCVACSEEGSGDKDRFVGEISDLVGTMRARREEAA